MSIPTDDELLLQIEAFLADTSMSPTRFGIAATGEGGLIRSIQMGRSITLRTGRRIVEFMQAYRAGEADTSPGIASAISPGAKVGQAA